MSIPWKYLSILFLAGLLACATSNPDASTGDGGNPAPPEGCEAGLSQDCFCADGNSGSQECNDEGTAFDDCICLETPPDATSDSGGGGEDVSEDNGNNPLPFPGEDGGGPPQGGPQTCESQADCDAEGGCPEDAALGCECVQGQNGQQRCIPRCETDEDCPTPGNPNITLTCNNNGLCRPDQGQGGEPPEPEPEPETDDCENDEDCAVEGACNPNAVLGCTCMATANGTLGCRPKCETAEDCPTPPNNPDFQVLCTDDGVCQPNNGGGGEEPEPEPTGPPTCETAADCEAVCPAAATMGCGCAETPNGEMICRVKCETTDDCPIPPNNPNANPQCTDDGYCVGGNQGGGNQPPQ